MNVIPRNRPPRRAPVRRPRTYLKRREMSMPSFLRDWDPPRRRLRRLAWVVALGVAIAAWLVTDTGTGLLLRFLAAFFFAVGTVWPGVFRPLYRILVVLAYPLRWVIGDSFLAVLTFGLLTPLALCWRVLGPYPGQKDFPWEAESYWETQFKK